MKTLFFTLLCLSMSVSAYSQDNFNRAEELKREIVELARTYEELAFQNQEGDESLEKQESLEVLVSELLELKPQPPVKDRLDLIAGVWRQIWGPYNYQTPERIVPDGTFVKEIYQAVSSDGFYYNVTPQELFGRFEYISLLRGEFVFSQTNPNGLDVKFTGFRFNRTRPEDMPIWELAPLAETGDLPKPFNVFPDFIVRNFERGTLDEIYTDEDIRILYGRNSGNFSIPFIYVMERVDDL